MHWKTCGETAVFRWTTLSRFVVYEEWQETDFSKLAIALVVLSGVVEMFFWPECVKTFQKLSSWSVWV